jgi:zinc and cadmium transporter
MLLNALLATLVVSLASFIGVITLFFSQRFLERITVFLVALAAGAMMGGAFFHILPESLEYFGEIESGSLFVFVLLMAGFLGFFVLERVIHWRHCHKDHCDVHPFAYSSLIGDGVHNLTDGMLIFAAFATDFHVGLFTTAAVIAHEIPQELGDFGVLIHAGFSRARALFWNFISAVMAMAGALIAYFIGERVESFAPIALTIAAGGFLYIAASDLVPEFHREKNLGKSILTFVIFLASLAFMLGFKIVME